MILMALAMGTACERCAEQAPPDAGGSVRDADSTSPAIKLTEVRGSVEWRRGKEGLWRPATEGQPVLVGDGVRTATRSSAVVLFDDGSRLRLKPETELTLSGLEGEFDLLLGEGSIDVEAAPGRGTAFRLMFGKTNEMVVLREGRAELKIEEDGVHIQMIMGQAVIHGDGEAKPLLAGKSFLLSIGKAQIVGRESLETTLRDRRRASRIKAPESRRFLRPKKSSLALQPGTTVRTAKMGGVELLDPAGGRVLLGPRSTARFEGTFKTRTGREGQLRLDRGQARVVLRRDGGSGATQEVVTPMASVKTSAAGLTADVTVLAQANSTKVVVHTGQAEIHAADKMVTIKAGQMLQVGPKGFKADPSALPPARLRAQEGKKTHIFFDRKIQQIRLSWKADADERSDLEVSAKEDFSELFLREPVVGPEFNLHRRDHPTLFWRVVRADGTTGATGSLRYERDPFSKARADAATNVVPDTGIKTTVVFQGKVPALTFKWQAHGDAASYLVQVFSEDELEKPVLTQHAKKTRLILPAGKLSEGTYFWYQLAQDADGKELKASQMNKLVLIFDNAVRLLRIDSPHPGQRAKGGQMQVTGLAPVGAKLTVNGKLVSVSADGRFSRALSGVGRGAVLVFRLQRKGRADVIFTRHLGR